MSCVESRQRTQSLASVSHSSTQPCWTSPEHTRRMPNPWEYRMSCSCMFIFQAVCAHHGARTSRRRRYKYFCANKQKTRSEEHTSELQSHLNLVCRLLLEKKKTHV